MVRYHEGQKRKEEVFNGAGCYREEKKWEKDAGSGPSEDPSVVTSEKAIWVELEGRR